MSKNKRPLRPRNGEQTRAHILRAARTVFATQGYAHAGLRQIAALARIDPALIVHYFGSKKDLFGKAMAPSISVEPFLRFSKQDFGREVVEWIRGQGSSRTDPLAALLLSSADREVSGMAARMVRERIVAPLANWLGPPNAEARSTLIVALLSGVFIHRHLLPLKALTKLDSATAVWLGSALQRIVEGVAA